jgi:hypothetical protein
MERRESLFRTKDPMIRLYKARLEVFDKCVRVVRRTLRHTPYIYIIVNILRTPCSFSGKVLA